VLETSSRHGIIRKSIGKLLHDNFMLYDGRGGVWFIALGCSNSLYDLLTFACFSLTS